MRKSYDSLALFFNLNIPIYGQAALRVTNAEIANRRVRISDMVKPLPQVYIVLNGGRDGNRQYAALSEDGYCLASIVVPDIGAEFAMKGLATNPRYLKEYEAYYPLGYELVVVKDINAPENAYILRHLHLVTSSRIREHNNAKSRRGN